jgi:hypothetical protein
MFYRTTKEEWLLVKNTNISTLSYPSGTCQQGNPSFKVDSSNPNESVTIYAVHRSISDSTV